MTPNRTRLLVPALVGLVTAVALALLVDPVSRQESHYWRGVLALVAIGLVWARVLLGFVRASEALRRAWLSLLSATAVAATFNYFQFSVEVLGGINDYTDTAYYYTNSKYLQELGYDGLYAGALLCDAERGAPRTRTVATVRDLRDDVLRSREDELRHGEEVKAAFTPERWQGFCHDITFFLDHLTIPMLETNFFVDHGYNPPPTWTLVGGNLCWLVDVEGLKWICTADSLLVIGMFAALGWVFGAETLGFVLLFWAVTFSGRWPILGMAILRFDWVVALVLGMTLLRVGRYAGAGAALAYAALNRVFPAIFFWAWLVEAALDTWREKRVPRKHIQFAAAAGLVTAVMVGGSALQYGPHTLVDAAQSLRLHNESFSSHRVGLGTVMVWKGETTREQIRRSGSMGKKELAVQGMKWQLRGAGVVVLLALAGVAFALARRGRPAPAWEMVPWIGAALFCATTPQVNYYNFRAVAYVWHGDGILEEPTSPNVVAHAILLTLLFGTEVGAQYAQWHDWERHAVNGATSWGMLAYFVAMGAFLVMRAARPASAAAPAAAPAAPAAPAEPA